ncbi:uncharacterized protein LOC110700882 [Chenopodium quinoa]|uniref:uncharacterized protein LOC110700882 n=1 Tax=Chenopodium quinoa TaxID=63459 RepID=UPI000B77D451|nr:uncharacterized protein LOC110700882 [Chenopodium quinoa]
MALKLDMSKAYDRVEWNFIESMMLKLGFDVNFVALIMRCLSSVSYSLLVNGFPSDRFVPTRGLRQGDPISPFLFLICAEGFSALLRNAESRKYDSLLFTRASEADVEAILDILSTYELASGQKLNLEKSEVSFSRNVSANSQEILQSKLNFTRVEGHDKYLGLPTYIGRSKKIVFQTIQDRVWKKVKGWKERFLSRAGREVPLKSVAQAIPTYAMQCFKLPESVIGNITSLCRNFWWGQKGSERKLALISWEKLCKSKREGGIGFRDLRAFNCALLARQFWRIATNPNSLAGRILKGKYFQRSTIWDAKVPPNASYTWRSIISARDLVVEGSSWLIGNGKSVRLWGDKWIPKLPGNRISCPPPQPELRNATVDGWIDPIHRNWRVQELRNALSEIEVAAITKIRIPNHEQEDVLQWKHTKNGEFNVLSARGVNVDRVCPRCGEVSETTLHLFLDCAESKILWRISPARIDTCMPRFLTLYDWCLDTIEKCKLPRSWEIIMLFVWKIWELRNLWVFEKKKIDLPAACMKTLALLGEFEGCLYAYCNKVAHLIAKSSMDHNELSVLMEDCSSEIWPAVLDDKAAI